MAISRRKVNLIMDSLGFRESSIGTEYIRQAVDVVDGQRAAMMSKEVYPTLARAANVTPVSVERAIRAAKEQAMSSPYWDVAWRGIGGWGRPTNKELVCRIAREAEIED